MRIKVNVNLMGKKPGDILAPSDKYYSDFKAWAERKDTRNGAIISELLPEEKPSEENEDEGEAGAEGGEGSADEPGPTGYVGPEEKEEVGNTEELEPDGSLKRARQARGQKK